MKHLYAILILFSFNELNAQSTLIEFNYQDETYKFFKITKKGDTIQTKRPYSFNGVPVKVVVKDLNTFCYDVTFKVKSFDEKPINSEQNVETLVSGYNTSLNSFNDLVGEVKENDIYQSLFENGKFQGIAGLKNAFGMAPDEFEKEYDILEGQSEILDEANSEMVKASKKIDAILDYIQLAEFTNQELLKLMNNPNLKEADLKKRAEALAMKVLDNSVELDQVIAIAGAKSSELEKQVGEYMTAYSKFENNAEILKYSINTLQTRVKSDEFRLSVNNLSKNVDNRYLKVSANYEELKTVLENDVNAELRSKLMEVYTNYDNIMNADFNYEYTLNTEQDVTRLTMEFKKQEVDSLIITKTRYLDVPTHGGLRINSSAGMSFISYFKGQQSYYNNGGVIGEEAGDLFLPSLTTMFHFYRQSYKPFAIGGSFGLSVPIEGNKEFLYMSGVSAIIGKTQRVIINAGAFGGKISRLDQGLRVGDALTSEFSEVPVRSVFDFGFYMGLTFNISSFF